jgi:hypothetical protein
MPWYRRGNQGKHTTEKQRDRCVTDFYKKMNKLNKQIPEDSKPVCEGDLWDHSRYAPGLQFISTAFRNYLAIPNPSVEQKAKYKKFSELLELEEDRKDRENKYNDAVADAEKKAYDLRSGGTRRRKTRRRKSRRR